MDQTTMGKVRQEMAYSVPCGVSHPKPKVPVLNQTQSSGLSVMGQVCAKGNKPPTTEEQAHIKRAEEIQISSVQRHG
jgi:hypothetical protein